MHDLDPYPSPDVREARLEALTAELGGEIQELGTSVAGRPIRAARLRSTGAGAGARVLVSANIHGVELIATRVALGFLEALKASSAAASDSGPGTGAGTGSGSGSGSGAGSGSGTGLGVDLGSGTGSGPGSGSGSGTGSGSGSGTGSGSGSGTGVDPATGPGSALDLAGELARLRARAEIWVLPSINPDGYARTWERRGSGTLKELRPNDHGVDLNRNFPVPGERPWYALALGGFATGSPDPRNAFYRGPHALSEPEAAAVAELLAATPFAASANLHSFMGTLLPAHVQDRTQFASYRRLCAAFRAGQRHSRYRPLSSRWADWLTGEMEDHQHHACGTWAICVEVFPLAASIRQHLRAPSLFWRFNPRDPETWVANDVPGLVRYFHAALDLGAVG